MGLKEFEFSQNYVMFWDKLEKANYFLEAIIDTADRAVDDRTVAHLLGSPAEDGGQWNMFVALVRKHGLVPKVDHAGDLFLVEHLADERHALAAVLREAARDLRAAAEPGTAPTTCARPRSGCSAVVHRILCDASRHPSRALLWQWTRQGPRRSTATAADAAGVRRQVRHVAARRLRLPGARSA